jgi:exosortase
VTANDRPPRPPPSDPGPAPALTSSTPWVRWAAGLGLVALLAWAFRTNLQTLYLHWSTDPDYSHGFLVVPVALVIFWQRPRPAGPLAPSIWGLIALAAVLGARSYLYETGEDWLETAMIVPATVALVLALGGTRAIRWSWPALCYLTFMLTLPNKINLMISQPLQGLGTRLSCALLRLTGLWVMAEGNVINVGTEQLEVAQACNGLSMLMSLSATVAAMIALVPMSTWKRPVLLLSVIPIGLLSNVLRIAATAWCYHRFGAVTGQKYAHDAAGWLMMPTALVLVALQMKVLSWLVVETEEPAPPPGQAGPMGLGRARAGFP